jgi:mono/diheme cytochrome c family protein
MRRTIIRGFAVLVLGGMTVGANGVAAGPDGLPSRQAKRSTESAEPVVTPVAGPSWLNHLGIRYGDTSLGRGAGRYGAGPNEPAPERKPIVLQVERSAVLTGADLYRLNCQACHRAEGTGAPPEVRSVLPVVQGSSYEMMRRKLRFEGRVDAGTAARQEANQAKRDLYKRIQHGGQKMPPRAHLQESDIDMLYAYLTRLAGTPPVQPQVRKTMSWERLGENVVKGTCHICHDAVGPRPTGQALLQGAIPPLTTLLADKSVVDFVNKVRSGAPTIMGDLPFHYRGRMPVFYYLTDQEVAAAYVFLTTYPPQAG